MFSDKAYDELAKKMAVKHEIGGFPERLQIYIHSEAYDTRKSSREEDIDAAYAEVVQTVDNILNAAGISFLPRAKDFG